MPSATGHMPLFLQLWSILSWQACIPRLRLHYPSVHISEENVKTIKDYTRRIAEEMHVKGLMNMQVCHRKRQSLCAGGQSPRIPYRAVSIQGMQYPYGAPLPLISSLQSLPASSSPISGLKEQHIPYYGVKEAVFPFNMFPEVDPVLGPEMRSTGEVLGLSTYYGEAFYKAQEATQSRLPWKAPS